MNISDMAIALGNTTTAVTLNLSGMSDAQVIERFCSSFTFFNAAMMGLIFLLIVCRALIYREKRRHPENTDYLRAYEALDMMAETLTIAYIVLSFLTWIFF